MDILQLYLLFLEGVILTSFCPTPWQEDPTPTSEQYCKDCGLYKQGSRMIWGEGNPKASIMIIR